MLQAMKKEIAIRKDYLGVPYDGRVGAGTLYFGGGTPSVLTIDELAGFLDVIHQYYLLDPDAEVTLEANPDDLTDEYLDGLRKLGFNRLSIGIQSFNDDDLKWMNRRHNGTEAIRSVKSAQQHGFRNINVDLIYGLPSLTPGRWKEQIEQFISLDVPHLSAYHLTIEQRTVFGRRQAKGEGFAIPEENSVDQFDMLVNMTQEAGMEHYEISNFAKPGFMSNHNSNYWRNKPYIGIGPSAHSYDGVSRQWNLSNNSEYIRAVGNGDGYSEKEELSVTDRYNDYILISLRTAWGVSADYINQHFGKPYLDYFRQQCSRYIRDGFMEMKDENTWVLTHKGKLIADRITSDLMS